MGGGSSKNKSAKVRTPVEDFNNEMPKQKKSSNSKIEENSKEETNSVKSSHFKSSKPPSVESLKVKVTFKKRLTEKNHLSNLTDSCESIESLCLNTDNKKDTFNESTETFSLSENSYEKEQEPIDRSATATLNAESRKLVGNNFDRVHKKFALTPRGAHSTIVLID